MGGRNSKEKSKVGNDNPENNNEEDFISFLDAASDGNFEDRKSGKGVKDIYRDPKKTNLLRQQLLLFQDPEQNTALHFAARNGSAEIVEYLIEQAQEQG